MILPSGELSPYVYFIMKGKVTITSEGATFKLAKLKRGSFFGELSVLFHSPTIQEYFADDEEDEDEIQCWCVDASYFVNLCEQFPEFNNHIRRKAMLRRAYWRRLEMKIYEQLTEFKKRKDIKVKALQGDEDATKHMIGDVFSSHQPVSDLRDIGRSKSDLSAPLPPSSL